MKIKLVIPILLMGLMSFSSSNLEKQPTKLMLQNGFVEIPSGKVFIESKQTEVGGFFIAKHEVTNQSYNEFLVDLSKDSPGEALHAQIQAQNWGLINVPEGMMDKYHTYTGFKNFPVVNVSYEGATMYCKWLEAKIAKDVEGYKVERRLPTKQEWIRAARGEKLLKYSWEHPYLMNAEGRYLCNFRKLGSEHIHFNQDSKQYEVVSEYDGPDATLTTVVGAYQPNEFGVFDMCGNVAEMISKNGIAVGGHFNSTGYDVRVESSQTYEEASPLVGFRPVIVLKK